MTEMLDTFSPWVPGAIEALNEAVLDEALDVHALDAWLTLYERVDMRSAFDDVPYAVIEAAAAKPEALAAVHASLARRPTRFAVAVLDKFYPRRKPEVNAETRDATFAAVRAALTTGTPRIVAKALVEFLTDRDQDAPAMPAEPDISPEAPALQSLLGATWDAPAFAALRACVALHPTWGDAGLLVYGPHGLGITVDETGHVTDVSAGSAWNAQWPRDIVLGEARDALETRLGEPRLKNERVSQWAVTPHKLVLARFADDAVSDVILRWFADPEDMPKPKAPPPVIDEETLVSTLDAWVLPDTDDQYDAIAQLFPLGAATPAHAENRAVADAWVRVAARYPHSELREVLHAVESIGDAGMAAALTGLQQAPTVTGMVFARRAINAGERTEDWRAAVAAARASHPDIVEDAAEDLAL